MRILIGGDTFAPDINGSASFVKRLAVVLAGRGHEVHIVAPSPDGPGREGFEMHDGIQLMVHRLTSWRWYPHPWLRFALPWRAKPNGRRLMKEVKPDVVHFQSHIIIGNGLAPAAKAAGIRLIGTNHVMAENIAQHVTILPPPLLRWLIRVQWKAAGKVYGLADEVTTPTKRSSDYFEQMTGLRGVHSISNGIDAANYHPNYEPRVGNRIVFVGRLDEEKCIHELLEAAALLDPALGAKVDIVGMGEDLHRLQKIARDLGIADVVTFHGATSDEQLRDILTAGAVFAMPSRAELQCIAAMEAMASALPVVAADAMALPHLVHPGENGYLYEPGNIPEFAAHLTSVLTAAPAEYTSMKKASQRIVAKHDLQHTVDVFEALYRGDAVTDPVTEPVPIPRISPE
ncbi:MAG: glycosyltransferase [Pseudolysinimonas sp.]|uniref:glycosyltransferase n=1 Tax=Pseudolysinimonas sp. TaxID=2680009 RepID=UPI0032671FD7